MICLRCGYCCYFYDVIIIKPEAISLVTEQFFDDPSCMDHLIHKPSGELCPHFDFDTQSGVAICKIHDLWWFEGTPCGQFSQIGPPSSPCRTGVNIRQKTIPNIYYRPDIFSKFKKSDK